MLMRRLGSAVQAYLEDARAAVRIAPIEVGLGLLAASTLSIAIAAEALEGWTRIAVAALIAFPLVLTTSMLATANRIAPARRWTLAGAALIAAGAYGLVVFDPDVQAEIWRAAMLAAAALIVPTLTPVLAPSDSTSQREWFWLFNLRLGLRAVTVYGFAAALMLGLFAAVAAIDELFGVNIPGETYAHIASALLVGLAPWSIAGGVPSFISEGVAQEQALTLARRVGLYLLLPLLAIYTGILYAYAVRIVFVTELPNNLVSPLVLTAGTMWLLAALVLEPFHWLPNLSGVARIIRVLPLLILPLVVLGSWAIGLRIEQHGWTEFRYARMAALAAMALIAIVGIVRLLRKEAPPLYAIPLVLLAVLLPSTIGPLSATAVSKRSQRAELTEALRAAGFTSLPVPIHTQPPAALRQVSSETYQRLASSSTYLVRDFGPAGVEGLLSGDTAALRSGVTPDRLGLLPGIDVGERLTIHANVPAGAGIPIIGPGTMYGVQTGFTEDATGASATFGEFTLHVEGSEPRLVITRAGEAPLVAGLAPLIARIEAKAVGHDRGAIGPNRVRMRFLSAELVAGEGAIELLDASGLPGAQLIVRQIAIARGPNPNSGSAGTPAAQANNTGSWIVQNIDALLILRNADGTR
jgi:hypothetical protein